MYNKFFIQYQLFTLLGLFSSLILKFDYKIPNNEIVILGRGNSLNKFKHFIKKNIHINNICLVNFDNYDLLNFDINLLNQKTIHMFVNSSEPSISIFKMLDLRIGHSYFMRSKNASKLDRKHFFLNKFGNVINYLPKEFYNDAKNYRNSGLLTIAFVTKIWKPKKIYLFGFDFYQSKMHNKSIKEEFKTNYSINAHVEHGKLMKKQLKEIILSNKRTEFILND